MKNKKKEVNKNVAKKDAKITLNSALDGLKDLKFKSGKPEEIKKAEFKLSF